MTTPPGHDSDKNPPASADTARTTPSPSGMGPGIRRSFVQRVVLANDRFRWKWAVGIVAVGAALEVIVWNAAAPDRTYQVMYSMPIVSAIPFALGIWWTLFSGLHLWKRGAGILFVVAVIGGFFSQYRFVGFEGDMLPIFQSRSEPTAGDKLDSWLAADRQNTADISQPVSGIATDDAAESPLLLAVTDQDWPGYRGPDRDGVVRSDLSGVDWSIVPEELWRHPIGAGWSSFAVVDGLAFTQEQRADRECVVCYDIQTGRQIWEHADGERFYEPLGGLGPRATPTISDSRVYSLGPTGVLNCLEARTGTLVWRRNILQDAGAKNLEWAMSASPLVLNGQVITVPGGGNDHSVIAYRATDGEIAWHAGKEPASYTAPVYRTVLGKPQLLIFHGLGLSGINADDGHRLWDIPWTNDPKVNAAVPIVIGPDSLLIAGGYGNGSQLVRFSNDGDAWQQETVWTSRSFKLKFNAAVLQGNYAYGLDEGYLRCLNVADGSLAWKRNRDGHYGYGQLLLAGDMLVVQAESGEVAFVRASPDALEERLRFPALTARTWNHPVIWRDLLLVRNAEEVACFRLAMPSQQQ